MEVRLARVPALSHAAFHPTLNTVLNWLAAHLLLLEYIGHDLYADRLHSQAEMHSKTVYLLRLLPLLLFYYGLQMLLCSALYRLHALIQQYRCRELTLHLFLFDAQREANAY